MTQITHRVNDRNHTDLLASLSGFDRQELLKKWRNLYGTEPPVRISQQLLMQTLAYRLQEQALGGLKPSTRRFLAKVVEEANAGRQISAPPSLIKSGTRLIREWHGHSYEVTMMESGVLFKGKHYRSLSEVAHIITGVKWSGPLFFGLKKKEAA